MHSDQQIAGLFQTRGSPYRKPFTFEGRPLNPEELFLVLNLQQPGLESARAALKTGGRESAAKALLTYFRNRASVAWPTWPALDNNTNADDPREPLPVDEPPLGPAKASALPPLSLADKDRAVAVNALQHIFQTHPSHAPHNYGTDINWDEDPYDAIEWTSGMHRMTSWDLAVARCYNATTDPAYARLWMDLIRDWIRKNPITKGRCCFAKSWDSIQVGFRARRWCGLLPYFLDAQNCTPDFLVEILTALYNHARRIVVLPYVHPDNFLIIESAALADIALTFPEFLDAEEWRQKAFERLAETLRSQVLPDGVHHELAPSYHLYCAMLFLDVIDLTRRNGFNPPFLKVVESMAQAVFGWTSPMRLVPVVGDTLRPDARRVLMRAAHVFGRSDFLAAATDGAKGNWPAQRNFAFRSGGFYAFRSDWTRDAVWLALHCGPRSGEPTECHAQPDNGTFELAAFGRYLMRDPGVYSYNWNHPEERAPFRSTAWHQTLTLDGANSARAGRCRDWVEDDGQGNAGVTVENLAYPGLIHRRTVFFVARRFFVLVDEALGNVEGTLDLHFNLTPGQAQIEPATKCAWTTFPTGGNVLVWAEPTASVTLREEQVWFSPWFGEKEPLPAFAYCHAGKAPERFLTLLIPFQGSARPEVAARIVFGEIGAPTLAVEGRVAGIAFRVQRGIAVS
ncbi:MAG: alginate lyase family protein [Lentisphaerae bacterium]|nr:alginate lyase family protein [Lentisphaerota bacterium]